MFSLILGAIAVGCILYTIYRVIRILCQKKVIRFKKKYGNYFFATIVHKYYVFLVGRKLGVPIIRLITHDLSKFNPIELFAYNNRFFKDGPANRDYEIAWLHHQNKNDHHWEYWIPRSGATTNTDPSSEYIEPIPMSKEATLEMVADWVAACKTWEGDWPDMNDWPFIKDRYPNMPLHAITREYIYNLLQNVVPGVVDELKNGKKKPVAATTEPQTEAVVEEDSTIEPIPDTPVEEDSFDTESNN